MKRCPTCNRTYTDLSLNFCLEDGTPLTVDAPSGPDPNATLRYPSPRDTAEPPPTEIYHPPPVQPPRPGPTPPSFPSPQQWTPSPTQPPRKKSNALWWILGGFAALVVIGAGLVIMLIALASLGNDPNSNNLNANSNTRQVNGNSNVTVNANLPNSNATVQPTGPFADDFSEKKWTVGVSQFGRLWYENDEYHMNSKEGTYIVMYAPSDDYFTENATVKVTARSVDGHVPSDGFGLLVHGGRSKANRLDDYGLVLYPGDEPEYEIIMHKDGTQSSLVARTKSAAIRPGTNRNNLEVRIKGTELAFYINGQFLTRLNDVENFKRGRVGFYTSDVSEVAFDNLQIDR
jgi:hypothetical protein